MQVTANVAVAVAIVMLLGLGLMFALFFVMDHSHQYPVIGKTLHMYMIINFSNFEKQRQLEGATQTIVSSGTQTMIVSHREHWFHHLKPRC